MSCVATCRDPKRATPGAGVSGLRAAWCGYWESNSSPLPEQEGLLATKPSL